MTQYWGGGGTKHFFLLTLYNFKTIGRGGHVPPLPPYSAVPVFRCIQLIHTTLHVFLPLVLKLGKVNKLAKKSLNFVAAKYITTLHES